MVHSVAMELGGRTLTIETGKLAQQADGAVTVKYGDTVVLVTACASPQPRADLDFLPLTVDYEERLYAAGKIPGGFFRREGRPSQEAILTMRLTDRPLRPLFPKGFRNDVQVIITVLSADQENDPDLLAIIGASSALGISSIPFQGPVSACRIGRTDGKLAINPTYTDLQQSQVDLVVAGTDQAVIMVEASAREAAEADILEALRQGQEVNRAISRLQHQLIQAVGRPKLAFSPGGRQPELEKAVASHLSGHVAELFGKLDKEDWEEALSGMERELIERLSDNFSTKEITAAFSAQVRAEVRQNILEKGLRPDGRHPNEIRPIACEVGILPRTHGSGLFTRGQTQVLSITTLGSMREEQMLDGLSPEERKRFMHHYNFPPFSTGEVKRLGSPGRREIGHGALAERSLLPVIPSEVEFPYTIRLVSEVLSSNGSTSMASVCGSSLSLRDAGVPIKSPVAGVAMGLVAEGGRYATLTDIAGIEDALGDMDFKVAGTAQGITALQMDIKTQGISFEVLPEALEQARQARLFILEKMQETIATSRPQLSAYAPRMVKITVPPENIRALIGPGGRTIRSLTDQHKVTIEVQDDGTVIVGSPSEEALERAIRAIRDLTRAVVVGEVYTGKVTRIMNFGAFVEILPGKEGLVHISELADFIPRNVEDVVKAGDEVTVLVTEIDRQGRINLSRRAIFEKLARMPSTEPPPPPALAGERPSQGQPPERRPQARPQFQRSHPGQERRPGGPPPGPERSRSGHPHPPFHPDREPRRGG